MNNLSHYNLQWKKAMNLLKSIKTTDLDNGEEKRLPVDRKIEGDPLLTTWTLDTSGENVRTGVFQAEPGLSVSRKGSKFEFCHILEGIVELCEEGGKPITYRAGDTFVLKPGFIGTWRTIETVRKLFVVVDQAAQYSCHTQSK